MQHLHIISHSHWDREWYRTFQQFRLQLVHMVDNLLAILDSDPSYEHFMLDGQSIVLEDYLQMRMRNFPILQRHIRSNRILIGPWYILPDEFLVSGEATIRNLLIGKQICELFDQRMMIGYIPDPFGHISQMPQILNGFHIDTACLWRGVKTETPTLVTWEAPDSSQVLLTHLYNGYGNIADWPKPDLEQSLNELDQQANLLERHNPSCEFLMMRGTDHLEPRPEVPEAIRYYNNHHHGDRQALHSTLPAYLTAVTQEIEEGAFILDKISGELRDPHKAHMLPGVLSARMWIKQRNHYSQTLLERWVEPFSSWAELVNRGDQAFTTPSAVEKSGRIMDPGALIHQTWKLLITNHPHDSICGCSIDATHNDMISRFDQVDQVGEELTKQSLETLTAAVDTQPLQSAGQFAAITVFNAAPYPKTGLVEVSLDMPSDLDGVKVLDAQGHIVPCQFEWGQREAKESNLFHFSELASLLTNTLNSGRNAQTLININLSEEDGESSIEADFSSILPPDEDGIAEGLAQIGRLMSEKDPSDLIHIKTFNIQSAKVTFLASNVPAFGLNTYWAARDEKAEFAIDYLDPAEDKHPQEIENEFLLVGLDGSNGALRLHDKRSNADFSGLNAIVDVGDRGDEYNFTPPENDRQVLPDLISVDLVKTGLEQFLVLHCQLDLPEGLAEERNSRSDSTVQCPLDMIVSLAKGVPAVDVQVQFDNLARDHRLEVRFPTGLNVENARYDGHFDIIERPLDLPQTDKTWRELPRPEVPQQTFTDVTRDNLGLMIANQGLPEAATLRDNDGNVIISLTLLRSVGWLSRDDLWNRQGHAGPPIATPDAQELSQYAFDYRLIPHDGNWLKASHLAHTFQTQLEAYVTHLHPGSLKPDSRMISVEPSEFLITAIKEAENETGWIVRGVNLIDEVIKLNLSTGLPVKSAALVNLDESEIEPLPMKNGSVILNVPAHKIVSILFKIGDSSLD